MRQILLRLIVVILSPSPGYAAQSPQAICQRGFETVGENSRTALDEQFAAFERMESSLNQLASSVEFRAAAEKINAEQVADLRNKIRALRTALGEIESELASERLVPVEEFQSVADGFAKIREEPRVPGQAPKVAELKVGPQNFFAVTRKAEKEIEGLQPKLQERYLKFVEEVQGLGGLRNLRPNWRLEKIDLKETGYDQLYSVELNNTYRLIFRYSAKDGILVLRASKTASHSGH